jgi:hypothetical protein
LRWLPAETVLRGNVSSATDVFSFAVLLWEVLDGGAGGAGARAGAGAGVTRTVPHAEFADGGSLFAYAQQHGTMPVLRFSWQADDPDSVIQSIFNSCHATYVSLHRSGGVFSRSLHPIPFTDPPLPNVSHHNHITTAPAGAHLTGRE